VLNGGDIVQRFIDRCRAKGQAAFISLRMNDAHHKEFVDPKPGDKPGSSIGVSVTRWYAEHPEHRIKPGSLRGADLVLNWAETEVRAQKLAMLRELIENYDFDGLELDFLRFYSYFRPETPLEQRRAIMTNFVQDVRNLLGPKKWLCARVPCYLTALDELGLDLKALVAAGLDMVNASAHYFTTQQHDLAAIRQLTTGATLYFELCHTIWKGDKVQPGYDVFPFRRATREHLHTSAHLAYASGADGISLFNFAYYRQHGQGEDDDRDAVVGHDQRAELQAARKPGRVFDLDVLRPEELTHRLDQDEAHAPGGQQCFERPTIEPANDRAFDQDADSRSHHEGHRQRDHRIPGEGLGHPGPERALGGVGGIGADHDHFAVGHVDDAHQSECNGESKSGHQQHGAE
jgi:hypothetical protein